MNESGVQVLMDQETIARRVETGDVPAWVRDHYESFVDGLLGERNDSPFPCYFGVESVKQGWPLYTAVGSMTDKDALFALGETLLEYLEVYETHAEQSSLVAFFKPPELEGDEKLTEADYHEALWHILQVLHAHDPEPWPEDIPIDPDTTHWEFCFGGEAFFPTCRAPFYDTYSSRYCPIGLEITFQPRTLFEGITADTTAGQHAREIIHGRLEEYDGVCPHADLGGWGIEGDREWPQYMLREDDEQAPTACPMQVSRTHPKGPAVIGD